MPPTPPKRSQLNQNSELHDLQKRWVFTKLLNSQQLLFEKLDAHTTLSLHANSHAASNNVLSLSGSIGCNRMSKGISIDVVSKTITSINRPMGGTLMSCGDSDAIERVFS